MVNSASARARIAAQQAALVTALVDAGEPPAHFDAKRLRATKRSLARKRARAVARAWPELSRNLGEQFDALFASYATSGAMLPSAGGPLADGRAFVRYLAARGKLPEAGRTQSLAVDLQFSTTRNGLVPRRWPACRAAWLRTSRRLLVGVRLPWLGLRWLSIPLGWRRA